MNLYLVEINTQPNTTHRLQYGVSLVDVATLAANLNLPVKSVKQISPAEGESFRVSGVATGLDFNPDAFKRALGIDPALTREATAEYLIKGITDNWPESVVAFDCVKWRYEALEFTFIDYEDGKRYHVNRESLLKAFDLLFTPAWPKGCTQPRHIGATEDQWNDWLCQADATDFDAFAQLAVFGEVIYG